MEVGGTVHKTTTYEYDLDGALVAVVFPSGRRIEYTVDFAGRPTEIRSTAPGSGTTTWCPRDGISLADSGPSGPAK